MATVNEISNTLKFLKNGLNKKKITLLHCNSGYPTYSDTNLKAMLFLNKKFLLPVGISDHTFDIEVQ